MKEQTNLAARLGRRLRGERRGARPGGRRRSDHEPNRGWIPALLIALTVAGLDWTTKWLVAISVPLGDIVEVVDGRVALWHVRNDAMILGLYSSLPIESRQVIAALAGMLGVVLLFEVIGRGHRLPARHRPWVWLFVGLAFGGMLGNLGERAVHWGVTDFLSFRYGEIWLPPGNVADLALFASMPVAALVIWFELAARARRAPAIQYRERRLQPAMDQGVRRAG
jgi:signal peptidase II